MDHIRSGNEFLFMKHGRPYAKDTLYGVWRAACEKAEVDYITIYQASRHSTASQIRQEKQLEAEQEVANYSLLKLRTIN